MDEDGLQTRREDHAGLTCHAYAADDNARDATSGHPVSPAMASLVEEFAIDSLRALCDDELCDGIPAGYVFEAAHINDWARALLVESQLQTPTIRHLFVALLAGDVTEPKVGYTLAQCCVEIS